jgi:hypothetical protein
MEGDREVVTVSLVAGAAFSIKLKFLETPAALAFSVTTWALMTEKTVALNAAVVAFASTVTLAGTVTAALLLARLTLMPSLGAAAFRVTVQE